MFNISNHIQFGFDVATSITIIATAATWAISAKKERKEKEEEGLDDRARSASLNMIHEAMMDLESPLSQVKTAKTRVDNLVKNLSTKSVDRFLDASCQETKQLFIDLDSEIVHLRKQCDVFLEKTTFRLYLLKPVLLSIAESKVFLNEVNKDIQSLKDCIELCRRIESSSLITIKNLHDTFHQKQDLASIKDLNERLHRFINSDKHVLIEFEKALEEIPLQAMHEGDPYYVDKLEYELLNNKSQVFKRYYQYISSSLNMATEEIIVGLGAVSGRLASKRNDSTLMLWKKKIKESETKHCVVKFKSLKLFGKPFIFQIASFTPMFMTLILLMSSAVPLVLPLMIEFGLIDAPDRLQSMNILEIYSVMIPVVPSLIWQAILTPFTPFLIAGFVYSQYIRHLQLKWFGTLSDLQVVDMYESQCLDVYKKHSTQLKELDRLLKKSKRCHLIKHL